MIFMRKVLVIFSSFLLVVFVACGEEPVEEVTGGHGLFGHDVDEGPLGFLGNANESPLRNGLVEGRCARVDRRSGLLAGDGDRRA